MAGTKGKKLNAKINHSSTQFRIKEGTPLPLGVRLVHNTMYFSVSAPNAKICTLNIYSKVSKEIIESIKLMEINKKGNIFYIAIQDFDYNEYEYMYEVEGKEFIDPYAKVVSGRNAWGKPVTIEEQKYIRGGFHFESYPWDGDKPLKLTYDELIIYRLHVRGFTKDTSSKVKDKGTFQGVIQKIEHLTELGINAVEILPAYEYDEILMNEQPMGRQPMGQQPMGNQPMEHQSMCHEDPNPQHHKINYWGYSEYANYFAPKSSYAMDTNQPITEFKDLVKSLHNVGIEVIMEFSFAYGTKEQLILDCLRYWVSEYHIDGFKINQDRVSHKLIATDPFLSDTKIFGLSWNEDEIYGKEYSPEYKNLAEYNEGFLIDMRRFLKGDEEQVSKAAFRYKRNPAKIGVINYITNTNGFTLMDLFSYDRKHNELNGESGHDGTDYNYSWNCGVEGNTRRKKVLELRIKQIKNALVLLILSQGTPLILAGDEFGNTQNGNNNAYCQDNRVSWLNWKQKETNKDITEFLKELIQIRKSHPILHMNKELRAMDYASSGYPDLSYHGTKAWYPDYLNYSRVLGIMLCGRYAMKDRKSHDDSFYLAFNMHWEDHEYDLPKLPKNSKWKILIDTTRNEKLDKNIFNMKENSTMNEDKLVNQKRYMVKARSIVIFIGV